MSIYDFKATDIDGQERELKEFEGKVLLVVNTASKCGFTPQFQGLETLYERMNGEGLKSLGFHVDSSTIRNWRMLKASRISVN